jgi:hypothetical protein
VECIRKRRFWWRKSRVGKKSSFLDPVNNQIRKSHVANVFTVWLNTSCVFKKK